MPILKSCELTWAPIGTVPDLQEGTYLVLLLSGRSSSRIEGWDTKEGVYCERYKHQGSLLSGYFQMDHKGALLPAALKSITHWTKLPTPGDSVV